jgi:hypothetical protein
MSSRADEYRAKAKECLDTAGLTNDLDTKHALDELAHEWVKMAEEAEREDQ